jgi:hypothetical protein
MEDFILKMMAATFYVIIGGAILVWALDKFARAMEQLSRATIEDFVGAMIAIGIITVVALII